MFYEYKLMFAFRITPECWQSKAVRIGFSGRTDSFQTINGMSPVFISLDPPHRNITHIG